MPTHIHFTLSDLTPKEARALTALLKAVSEEAETEALATIPEAEVVAAPIIEAVVEPTPEPEPVKAPEPKAKKAKAPEPKPELASEPEPVKAPEPKPEPAKATEPTMDDIRAALMTFNVKNGHAASVELLADFGCKRVAEMDAKTLDEKLEFIKLANANA